MNKDYAVSKTMSEANGRRNSVCASHEIAVQ